MFQCNNIIFFHMLLDVVDGLYILWLHHRDPKPYLRISHLWRLMDPQLLCDQFKVRIFNSVIFYTMPILLWRSMMVRLTLGFESYFKCELNSFVTTLKSFVQIVHVRVSNCSFTLRNFLKKGSSLGHFCEESFTLVFISILRY